MEIENHEPPAPRRPERPNIENPDSKIYLTGFMGSGKTTIGPRVAQRLGSGWRFLDLDDAVAEQAGRAIPAIFAEEGETGFREREAAALRAVSEAGGAAVIATGGGTLVREENLQRARASGTVVYLRASSAVLAGRLRGTAAQRPLLQSGDGERPLAGAALAERIEALLAERKRFYERAHVTVDTSDATPEETAEAVARAAARR